MIDKTIIICNTFDFKNILISTEKNIICYKDYKGQYNKLPYACRSDEIETEFLAFWRNKKIRDRNIRRKKIRKNGK